MKELRAAVGQAAPIVLRRANDVLRVVAEAAAGEVRTRLCCLVVLTAYLLPWLYPCKEAVKTSFSKAEDDTPFVCSEAVTSLDKLGGLFQPPAVTMHLSKVLVQACPRRSSAVLRALWRDRWARKKQMAMHV